MISVLTVMLMYSVDAGTKRCLALIQGIYTVEDF